MPMKLGDYTNRRIPYIVAAALAPVDMRLKTQEDLYIRSVLEAANGNLSVAAKMLGVNRRMLQRRGYGNPAK